MRIVLIQSLKETDPISTELARFEETFRYPLGDAGWFRIQHGQDYPAFFRTMDTGASFVAFDENAIVGCLGVSIRTLLLPSGETRKAVYFGDLKTMPGRSAGRVLVSLIKPVWDYAREHNADCAFGVVMDGTPRTPDTFTGRLGIPGFKRAAKLMVLKIQGNPGDVACPESPAGAKQFRDLAKSAVHISPAEPTERSVITPVWLAHPQGLAAGRLEDTRKVKRLFDHHGAEMINAHLTGFAYQDIGSGASVIRAALARANALGCEGLFTCVSPEDGPGFVHWLARLNVVQAPATVYGLRLPKNLPWLFNTPEI